MKKLGLVVILLCVLALAGCSAPKMDEENKTELKTEIYQKAYEEGYKDAIEAMLEEMPEYMIEKEQIEEALYKVFEDGEYAEEVRDQLFSYCETYEKEDFKIEYTDSGMDYNY